MLSSFYLLPLCYNLPFPFVIILYCPSDTRADMQYIYIYIFPDFRQPCTPIFPKFNKKLKTEWQREVFSFKWHHIITISIYCYLYSGRRQRNVELFCYKSHYITTLPFNCRSCLGLLPWTDTFFGGNLKKSCLDRLWTPSDRHIYVLPACPYTQASSPLCCCSVTTSICRSEVEQSCPPIQPL